MYISLHRSILRLFYPLSNAIEEMPAILAWDRQRLSPIDNDRADIKLSYVMTSATQQSCRVSNSPSARNGPFWREGVWALGTE